MAVAYISDADKSPATGTSIAFTSVTVSGVNPAIFIGIGWDGQSANGATVSSVVCSAGLTGTPTQVLLRRNNQGGLETVIAVWKIPAPSGSGTVTATLSASVPWQANLILVSGADQSDPAPVADAVSAIAADPINLTPANLTANDAAIGFGGNGGGGDGPAWTVGTETFNNNTSNVNMAGGYHLGTGQVTVDWNGLDSLNTMVAVRVAAAAGGGSNTNATPGAGSLAISGTTNTLYKAPTPPSAALAFTGQAPTVGIVGGGTNTNATPAVGALVFTGRTPTSLMNHLMLPSTAALVFTGGAEGSAFGGPDTGALTLTGIAPSLFSGLGRLPSTAALSLSGSTPTVGQTYIVAMTTGALVFTGPPASVSSSASPNIQMPAGALSLTGQLPTMITPLSLTPGTGALVLSGSTPSSGGSSARRGLRERGRGRGR